MFNFIVCVMFVVSGVYICWERSGRKFEYEFRCDRGFYRGVDGISRRGYGEFKLGLGVFV